MTTITAQSWGYCYLLHFSAPLGNLNNARGQASHYIGWAADTGDSAGLKQRIAEHQAGQGSRITRAAVAQGIELLLVATWYAPLGFEKVLKRRKEAPKLCPHCAARRGCRRKVARLAPIQLALPLLQPGSAGQVLPEYFDDFPEPPNLPPDWYEISYYRRRHLAAAPAVVLADDWDDGLL